MKQPLILRVFRSNQLKEVRQFDFDQIVVGSNSDAQLILADEGVSPIHCLIEKRDSGYYICDLGSKSGTFKNGQAILDELLTSGDELFIGPYKIVFFVGVPRPVGIPKEIDESKTVAITSPPREEKTQSLDKVLDDDTTQNDLPRMPVKTQATSKNKLSTPAKKTEPVKSPVIKSLKKKKKISFAPPGEIKDLKSYLTPTRGSLVEVNVAWNNRIIQTFHFKNKGIYRSSRADSTGFFIPSTSLASGWPLIEIGAQVKILVPSGALIEAVSTKASVGEDSLVATGKALKMPQGTQVRLDQNELICIQLPDGNISLYVRFVESTPIVPFAPLLLSSSEVGSILIATIISGMLAFYVATMTAKFQPPIEEDKATYTAQVLFEQPKDKVEKIPPPPAKPVVEIEKNPPPPPPQPPKVVKMADEKKDAVNKGNPEVKNKGSQNQQARKAVDVAPIPNSQNRPKKFTSTKQGGAVKIGSTAGANAQSATKDINKIGLFSAFGSGGVRSKLDQAYAGAGDILGNADKATGSTGMGENREGDDLGSKFKDTGRGGKGTATEGIAGLGTKGRAGGTSEYGSAEGFGDKTSVAIQAGGSEEAFEGSIDKEAVRRRIKHNLNLIRGCYNQELNRLDKSGRRSLEGKVVLKWDIVDNGVARNVRVSSSSLGNKAIERCIAERLATIVFPDPPNDTVAEVSYPFVFKNEQ